VHDGEDADLCPNSVRISCKLLEGIGCCFTEGIEKLSLMSPDQLTEFLREGKDQMKIMDRQEGFPTFFHPLPGIFSVTLGTVAVAAGVVGIMEFCALIALEDVASKNFCAALSKVPQGADMAWKHPVLEFIKVVRTIEPERCPQAPPWQTPLEQITDRSSESSPSHGADRLTCGSDAHRWRWSWGSCVRELPE
jgi:hypothetical protein